MLSALRDWRRERLPGPLFGAVALAVAVASLSDVPSLPGLLGRTALAFLWLGALRLWDDLEDVRADRGRHPQRVLCRAQSRAPFVATLLAWLALDLALAALTGATAGLVAILGACLVWYRVRDALPKRVRAFGILAKYPAVAFVLADGHAWPGSLVLLTSLFVIDELIHP